MVVKSCIIRGGVFVENNENEILRKQSMRATIKLSLLLVLILTCIEVTFCIFNKVFIFFIWLPILPLIHILVRNIFFKNAQFCYGKITDVKLDDSDDVCLFIKIEFKDSNSNKIYETYVYEHWGDFDEENKNSIDELYIKEKEKVGKKVPVFYSKKNPNKNLVFVNN